MFNVTKEMIVFALCCTRRGNIPSFYGDLINYLETGSPTMEERTMLFEIKTEVDKLRNLQKI